MTWVADDRLSWTITVTAHLSKPPSPDALHDRLVALNRRLTGTATGSVLTGSDVAAIRTTMAQNLVDPVTVGLAGSRLVMVAHHQHLDGLGLLGALAELTQITVTSSARGIGDRRERAGAWRTRVQRLREVAFEPPDRVPQAGGERHAVGDSFAEITVPGTVHTSELIWASVAGVAAFSARRGCRAGRPIIAVGVSRHGGDPLILGDHSALLRLTGLSGAGPETIRRSLREAAPESTAATGSGSGSLVGRLAGTSLRILAPRLGSTLLVSHLGAVAAPGIHNLAFHPVTGGGSGVSIGGSVLGGSTTITARGRAARHSPDALAELLADVSAALPAGG